MTPPTTSLRPRIEEVSIEQVQLLDQVYVGPGRLRCVIAKACARGPDERIAGWRLELLGGESAWFAQHARVARPVAYRPEQLAAVG